MQVSRVQRSSWRSSEAYARYGNGTQGMEDPRFVRIDDEEIRLALSLYDRDPNVQMVSNVLLNSLLSAMIIFRHKGDTNRFANDSEEDRWRSQVYSDLCREMVRQKKALGWTAVTAVPDPRHVGRPVVLNLEKCEVYVNVDIFGIPHFRFFERIQFPELGGSYNRHRIKPSIGEYFLGGPAQLMGMDISSERREILNVKVFYEQAPTNEGHLRSLVLLLAPDLRFEEHLAACCTSSDAMRSNPPLVLQKESKKPDSKDLTMIDRFAPNSARSLYEGDGNRDGAIREAQVRQMEAQQYMRQLDGLVSERVNDASGAIPASLSTVSRKRLTGTVGLYEYELDTDRTVAKQVLPESPHDMYLNFRQARMERIMALFGVPAPMLTEKNSLGSKVSMNENAYVVYMEAQKHMKQTLISELYEIYRSIYDPMNALDYMHEVILKRKEKPSMKGLNESMDVIITMPGLPPEETVRELYTMGILKFDAYKRFLHDKHAIPLEDFNEEPEISVKDLNGCGVDKLNSEGGGDGSSGSSGSTPSAKRAKTKAK